jgi:hypothetical protein
MKKETFFVLGEKEFVSLNLERIYQVEVEQNLTKEREREGVRKEKGGGEREGVSEREGERD